jgi:uncharacterized repeat protein (TIGR01451 family)
VTVGDQVVYTVTVTNNGPNDATGVVLTDTLPADTTFVSAAPSQGTCPDPVGNTLTCNLGNIANGGSNATVEIVVTTGQAGTIINTVSVDGTEEDPVSGNDSTTEDTTVTEVGLMADLVVTKEDNADTFPLFKVINGANVVYMVKVTNLGPDDATNVALTDTLPDNATFISAVPSQGTCNPPLLNTLSCSLGTIASGNSATVTITMLTQEAGTLTNTVTTSSDVGDPDETGEGHENEVSLETEVRPGADIVISKVDNPDPVTAGDDVVYTVTVTNLGPDAAANVFLTDNLPLSSRVSGAVSAVPSQGTCDTTVLPSLFCELGAIAKDESATVTITITTIRSAEPEEIITNHAIANDFLSTEDPDNGPGHENEAFEETTIQPGDPLADLVVTKEDDPDPVIAGDNVVYTVKVGNRGPDDATNVLLTDGLPDPTKATFVSAVPSQGSCNPPVGNILTCNLGTIAPSPLGEKGVTVTITMKTKGVGQLSEGARKLTNFARVSSDVEDPNTTDSGSENEVTEETTVKPGADLVVTKTDNPDPVTAGDNVIYTVTVTNRGPDDVTNVVLEDVLPDDATLIPPIVSSQGACTLPDAGVMTCVLGGIASGNSATVTITMKTNENFDGTLSNSAEVSSDVEDPFTAGAGHENITSEDTTVGLKGDLNGDGCVDQADLRIIINAVRGVVPMDPSYDVNGDGNVDNKDISFMAKNLFTRPRSEQCK